MDPRLARVADELAWRAGRLSFAKLGPLKDPPKVRGPLWWVLAAPSVACAFVGMMRQLAPLSKKPMEDLVQAYRQATGVDRDQANADVQAIEERLRRLPRYGDPAEELVGRAARWLVDWAARGRPAGNQAWHAMEAAFEDMAAFEDEARGDWGRYHHRYGPIQARYHDTWRALLASADAGS